MKKDPKKRIRDLESLKAFLPNDKEIPIIIESCFLQSTSSWRKWTDHMGNYIVISSDKKINSYSSFKKRGIITDIYFKAPPKKISEMSNWAFISFGKDNKKEFSIAFIWMLGYDKKLRLLTIGDDEWLENNPPLACGVDTLRPILRNIDVENYRVADILNVKGPIPAVILKSWATQWPPSQEMKNEMLLFSKELGNKIIKDCL